MNPVSIIAVIPSEAAGDAPISASDANNGPWPASGGAKPLTKADEVSSGIQKSACRCRARQRIFADCLLFPFPPSVQVVSTGIADFFHS